MGDGKDNKAVIASNIMYVVGQYPQFLVDHWKFLKTVIKKLFEFMHERYPGVQDMSCDTLLKIAKACQSKFVEIQENESNPLVNDILENLPEIIKHLETTQIHTFYEAIGNMIKVQHDPDKRRALIFKLMELPNNSWSQMIVHANQNREFLREEATVKQIVLVLKANNRVAKSVGHGYIVQLARIYIEILQVYQMYSEYVSNRIRQEGEDIKKLNLIQNMQTVKKETLQVIQCFLKNTQPSDKEVVYTKFLPALMQPVLKDYKQNVASAKDAGVLSLFTVIITKLGSDMDQHIPAIFDSLFQPTLDLITKNFQDYPEHRIAFFKFLRIVNNYCFPALLNLNAKQFQLFMDSVMWGFKHLKRDIADIGLSILWELMKNVMEKKIDVINKFYKNFFMPLLQSIMGVLTDTFHKEGFQFHAAILASLLRIASSDCLTVSIWKEGSFPDNETYVTERLLFMLTRSFRNLTKTQIAAFVSGLFKLSGNLKLFKPHLMDFLIDIRQYNTTNKKKAEIMVSERSIFGLQSESNANNAH